jgi:hypothetical protein
MDKAYKRSDSEWVEVGILAFARIVWQLNVCSFSLKFFKVIAKIDKDVST